MNGDDEDYQDTEPYVPNFQALTGSSLSPVASGQTASAAYALSSTPVAQQNAPLDEFRKRIMDLMPTPESLAQQKAQTDLANQSVLEQLAANAQYDPSVRWRALAESAFQPTKTGTFAEEFARTLPAYLNADYGEQQRAKGALLEKALMEQKIAGSASAETLQQLSIAEKGIGAVRSLQQMMSPNLHPSYIPGVGMTVTNTQSGQTSVTLPDPVFAKERAKLLPQAMKMVEQMRLPEGTSPVDAANQIAEQLAMRNIMSGQALGGAGALYSGLPGAPVPNVPGGVPATLPGGIPSVPSTLTQPPLTGGEAGAPAGVPSDLAPHIWQPGEKEVAAGFGKSGVEMATNAQKDAEKMQQLESEVTGLNSMLKGYGGGLTTEAEATIGRWISNFAPNSPWAKLGSLSELATNIQNRITPTMRVPGSGSVSDYEERMFKTAVPTLAETELGRALITKYTQRLTQRLEARADIMQDFVQRTNGMPKQSYVRGELQSRFGDTFFDANDRAYIEKLLGQGPSGASTTPAAATRPPTTGAPAGGSTLQWGK